MNVSEYAVLTLSGEDVSGEPILLKQGWGLVGFNSLTALSAEEALSSIAGHFNSVWVWVCDPAYAGGGYWMLYDPDSPIISDLNTLEFGMGVWIDATDECTWTPGP